MLGVFLVGCRVGGCLMLMPGFSSGRVPVRVRLFIALMIALVVAPLVIGSHDLAVLQGAGLAAAIFAETVVGVAMGLVARIYLAGLGFMAVAMANFIGLNGIGGNPDGDEPVPTIASLVTVLATLILIMSDLHRYVITMVIDSYVRLPIMVMPDLGALLQIVATALRTAFLLGLQIVGPFVVYSLLVNMIFGIVGKLIPQVPSYFISVPFLVAGGLILIYFVLPLMMSVFARAIENELSQL